MQDLVCPVCKSKDLEIFQHGIFDSEETNVIECNNCKMRFLDKIMTPNEEEAFYADYYKSQKARQFKESSIKNFQERTYLEYMKDEEFFVNLLKDKKDIDFEVEGLDENYFYGYEDIDFAFKLFKAGYKSIFNPFALLFHHESATRIEDEDKKNQLNYKNIMYLSIQFVSHYCSFCNRFLRIF